MLKQMVEMLFVGRNQLISLFLVCEQEINLLKLSYCKLEVILEKKKKKKTLLKLKITLLASCVFISFIS